MRTRERILEGARLLFNAEGFSKLSALEIATALSMSPGHLYYHFKGKGEMALALLAALEGETDLIFAAAQDDFARHGASLSGLGVQLHILIEEMQGLAFVFREPWALRAAHPGAATALKRILATLEDGIAQLVGQLSPGPPASAFARHLALGVAFLPARLELGEEGGEGRALIAQAAREVLALAQAALA